MSVPPTVTCRQDKQKSLGKTRLHESCIMCFPLSRVPFTDNMSYFDPADSIFVSASVKLILLSNFLSLRGGRLK